MVAIDSSGNLTVYSGDDDYITFKYKDSRDISTLNIFFTIKPLDSKTTDDSDALLSIDPSDISFITSGTIAVIPINQHENRIIAGKYKFDLQKVTSASSVHTIHAGIITISNDITKRVA